jgi:hypothetical protein
MTKLGRLGKLAIASVVASGVFIVSTAVPANAAFTTYAGHYGAAIVLGCKKPIDSIYGPLWEITLVAATNPGETAGMWFEVRRGGSVVQHVDLSARDGAWDVKTTWASRILGDTYTGVAGTGLTSGEGAGGAIGGPFSTMAYC